MKRIKYSLTIVLTIVINIVIAQTDPLTQIKGRMEIWNRGEEIIKVRTEEILEKFSIIPISEWQYMGSEKRHICPIAQDFYAVFGLGQSETTIATVDADGMALAAIQALYDRLPQSAIREKKVEQRLKVIESQNSELALQILQFKKEIVRSQN